MKKVWKKLLAITLAVSMTMSMVSLSAFAEGEENGEENTPICTGKTTCPLPPDDSNHDSSCYVLCTKSAYCKSFVGKVHLPGCPRYCTGDVNCPVDGQGLHNDGCPMRCTHDDSCQVPADGKHYSSCPKVCPGSSSSRECLIPEGGLHKPGCEKYPCDGTTNCGAVDGNHNRGCLKDIKLHPENYETVTYKELSVYPSLWLNNEDIGDLSALTTPADLTFDYVITCGEEQISGTGGIVGGNFKVNAPFDPNKEIPTSITLTPSNEINMVDGNKLMNYGLIYNGNWCCYYVSDKCDTLTISITLVGNYPQIFLQGSYEKFEEPEEPAEPEDPTITGDDGREHLTSDLYVRIPANAVAIVNGQNQANFAPFTIESVTCDYSLYGNSYSETATTGAGEGYYRLKFITANGLEYGSGHADVPAITATLTFKLTWNDDAPDYLYTLMLGEGGVGAGKDTYSSSFHVNTEEVTIKYIIPVYDAFWGYSLPDRPGVAPSEDPEHVHNGLCNHGNWGIELDALNLYAVYYTVTYIDGVDGAAFEGQTYTAKKNDTTPTFDGTPARDGYTFTGWTPEVAENVTENVTYTAQWSENTFTVTWLDGYNETAVKSETYGKVTQAENYRSEYPGEPSRSGYSFTAWGFPVTDEDGNITITAQWSQNPSTPSGPSYYQLTINYIDEEGNALAEPYSVRRVEGSYSIASPVIEGYTTEQTVVSGILTEPTTINVRYTAVAEDVEETEPPLSEEPEPTETAEEPTEDLGENDTPLAETPTEEPTEEPGEEDLGENDTPLADVPQTGDHLALWLALSMMSALGLAWISLTEKKGKRAA